MTARSSPARRRTGAERRGGGDHRALLRLLAVAVLVLAACSGGDDGGDGSGDGGRGGERAGGDVPAVPPEVEAAADEWPLGGRDHANTRATTDTSIDSTTIDRLEVAWEVPLDGVGDWGAAASTPVIADGVVYLQDLQSNVMALDLATGEEVWRTEIGRSAIGPNGPAIGYGKVFLQDGEQNLIALDIEDGEELWSTELEPHTGTQQPSVFGGLVYTGTGAGFPGAGPEDVGGRESYVGGASGMVYGVEHDTGAIAWEFQVVEDDFWGDEENNGGGGIWFPPGIDTDTGASYWGTGNPAPFPGTEGSPNAATRPGDNLYTSSLIALDPDGELDWYHQAKPHDLFDLDFQISPVLATVDVEGTPTDLAIGAGKLGWVHAVDRRTGEEVWRLAVGDHQNDELTELPPGEEVLVLPGVWGGVESPLAYADGVVYAQVINLATPWTATGYEAPDDEPGQAVAAAEGRTDLSTADSLVVAIDAATGEAMWETAWDEPSFGGATVVNDLVLTADLDGTVRALARADGAEVWTMELGGGVNAWPAVAGDVVVWPVGSGPDPRLVALRLGDG